jgi:tRNA dimethylallyltransferase
MDGYNRQRIIRALEVYELTGRPISSFWELPPLKVRGGLGGRYEKIGLTLSRDLLYRRIEERVDQMIQRGWIDETEQLLKNWGEEAPALKIIGYRVLVMHLRGILSRKEALTQIKTDTRQLAKRQLTWFRRDTSLTWI